MDRVISPAYTELVEINKDVNITQQEIQEWLKLSSAAYAAQQAAIDLIVSSTVDAIERYTWYSIRRKKYAAFFKDDAAYNFIENGALIALQRAPILRLADIVNIEYLAKDDTYTLLSRTNEKEPGLFDEVTEIKIKNGWAQIRIIKGIDVSVRDSAYLLKVEFNVGHDPAETNELYKIPEALKVAILQIVAYRFTMRGDCQPDYMLAGIPIPISAKGIVDQYSIRTTFGGYYRPGALGGCNV
jgi:hypothetical protein